MIAETIQMSLTPVFALVAIGNILGFLTVRLGRVVDRSRFLQQRYGETTGAEHDAVVSEIRVVARRIELVGRAFLALVLSGVSIGLTVVALFVERMSGLALGAVAGTTFMLAIALLVAGLILFLWETRMASASLRIPETFLELDRKI